MYCPVSPIVGPRGCGKSTLSTAAIAAILQENEEEQSGGGGASGGEETDARTGPLANLAPPGRTQLLPAQFIQLLDRVLLHSALQAAGAEDTGGGGGGGGGAESKKQATPTPPRQASATEGSSAGTSSTPSARTRHPSTRRTRGAIVLLHILLSHSSTHLLNVRSINNILVKYGTSIVKCSTHICISLD